MMHFTTADRRLEQFLYAHFIPFDSQGKNGSGYTVWHYGLSPRLLRTVAEYRSLTQRYGHLRKGKSCEKLD